MPDEIWTSPYTLCQIVVQAAEPIYAGPTATIIGHQKEIVAEFGFAGPEIPMLDANGERVTDPYTGEPYSTASVVGGVFNLQAQAEQKGWTPEEVDLVRQKVDYVALTEPAIVQRRTAPKANPPWPTYDTTHHKTIPTFAAQAGLVGEALAYETQNKNRSEVVEKLREALAAPAVEDALVAE